MRSTQLAMMAGLAACATQDSTAMVDPTRPLVPMADYVPPAHFANDPNYHYPTGYRVLDCWECFEAQGKVCMDEGHNSLYHHTKSSDPGNAFCCKPDSTDGYCQAGATHGHGGTEHGIATVCSEPSTGATSKFKDILTGNRNHQLFAFCPTITHQKCGVQGGTGLSTNMGLKAGLNALQVQASDLRYKKATPADPTREYDACYYEVTLDESVLAKYDPKKLHVRISTKKDVNVYVYGGRSRHEATENVISGNAQASAGATYSIGVDKGFLIVAYPDAGAAGEFGFTYWLEAELKPVKTEEESTAVPIAVNGSGAGTTVTGATTQAPAPQSPQVPPPQQQPQAAQSANQPAEIQIVLQPEQAAKVQEQIEVVPVQRVQGTENAEETGEIQKDAKEVQKTNPAPAEAEEEDLLFYALCAGAGVLFIAIMVLCHKCRGKGKITTTASDDLGYPSGNEKSLQLDDLEDNPNDTGRPSLPKHKDVFENVSEVTKNSASYKQVNTASMVVSHKDVTV